MVRINLEFRMIDFLKHNKHIFGLAVGLLDLAAGIMCIGDDNIKALLFISLGSMFIVDALE